MAGRPTITIEVLASARKAKADIDSLHNHVSSRFGSIKAKVALAGAAIAGVAIGVVRVGKSFVTAGETAATSNARIGQVAKSMGLFGGQTQAVTNRLIKLANVTARQTGVDQNQIKLTQAKLMSFKELAATAGTVGDHFDRATRAAVDMGATGFGTAEQNAVQLGKALNDPIKGITALARSGVTFTEAEKAKIKTLVESNRMHEAQGLILSAIEKQVGGVAIATANGTDKIKVAWSQIKEKLGTALIPLVDKAANFINEKVMPAFERWADTSGKKLGPALEAVGKFIVSTIVPSLGAVFPLIGQIGQATAPIIQKIAAVLLPALKALTRIIQQHPTLFGTLGAAIVGVATGFKLFSSGVTLAKTAVSGLRIVQLALNAAFAANPIGLVITIIAALVAALITAWNTNEGFRKAVIGAWEAIKSACEAIWNAIVNFFKAIWEGIKKIFTFYLNFLFTFWKTIFLGIKTFFEAIWNGIKNVALAIWNAIKSFFTAWLNGAKKLWFNTWNAIKSFFTRVFNAIKTTVMTVLTTIANIFTKTFAAIKNIVTKAFSIIVSAVKAAFTGMVNAVRTGVGAVVGFAKGIGGRIKNAVGNLGRILLGPGKAIMDGLLGGIKSGFNAIKKFVTKIGSWIAAHKGPKAKDLQLLVPAGTWIMTGLMNGLESQRSKLGRLLGDIAADVSGTQFGAPGVSDLSLAGVKPNNGQNITINVEALTPSLEVGRVVAEALHGYTQANGRSMAYA